MKKYKTKWRNEIEEVEILRETDKCVFLKGRNGGEDKELKRTSWHNFFNTWEEARSFLLGKAKGKLDRANRDVSGCIHNLNEVEDMTPPH